MMCTPPLTSFLLHWWSAYRLANQAVFMAYTMAGLLLIGGLLGWPVVSTCMISAIIWGSSRINANDTIPFQFGLKIPRHTIPFALAAIDVLQVRSFCCMHHKI